MLRVPKLLSRSPGQVLGLSQGLRPSGGAVLAVEMGEVLGPHHIAEAALSDAAESGMTVQCRPGERSGVGIRGLAASADSDDYGPAAYSRRRNLARPSSPTRPITTQHAQRGPPPPPRPAAAPSQHQPR